jgi:hypothetical protein
LRDLRHFIDGASAAGTSGRFGILNPNTGGCRPASDRLGGGPKDFSAILELFRETAPARPALCRSRMETP